MLYNHIKLMTTKTFKFFSICAAFNLYVPRTVLVRLIRTK